MSKEVKRYAERDAYELDKAGNYYCRHVSAMTGEGLHSKSDIAAELGWRDMQIGALLAERDAMRSVLRDARQVIATALRASAPDWFETDEDVATHTTIKKIDAALQGDQP